jgi:hypothetical protein
VDNANIAISLATHSPAPVSEKVTFAMKTLAFALTILICVLVRCPSAWSQHTNLVFLPMEIMAFGETNANHKYNTEVRDTAIRLGECKPAELDPQGNWGQVVLGFQLSLRARTNTFSKRESVPVSIIFRNTTTNWLKTPDGPALAVVRIVDQSGRETSATQESAYSGPGLYTMPPMRQRKEILDLHHDLAALGPGTYRLYAVRRVFANEDLNKIGKMEELRSGTLTIKVVE